MLTNRAHNLDTTVKIKVMEEPALVWYHFLHDCRKKVHDCVIEEKIIWKSRRFTRSSEILFCKKPLKPAHNLYYVQFIIIIYHGINCQKHRLLTKITFIYYQNKIWFKFIYLT
jgi:hypothetical protein